MIKKKKGMAVEDGNPAREGLPWFLVNTSGYL
jgi:hypothetical protein